MSNNKRKILRRGPRQGAHRRVSRRRATPSLPAKARCHALIHRMTTEGPGEGNVPALIEAKLLEPLDVIELTKWLKDLAGYWQAHERKRTKAKEHAS